MTEIPYPTAGGCYPQGNVYPRCVCGASVSQGGCLHPDQIKRRKFPKFSIALLTACENYSSHYGWIHPPSSPQYRSRAHSSAGAAVYNCRISHPYGNPICRSMLKA
ncbi:hypothetical protein G7K_5040-t1 [Saitoella complicata NRRL Y-17804]|uniref:Uncharacterized protein n=1 Tax=Saitoella complicata (strain BCRC 22490 / CBS 7301 / JCM 7358 / NBRC 10748 / NRRL Y-17804) TaxID=698492 RepID=A0A0E9NMM7_SAICN|nr:hypothetical protein G7K_5040-t1 [Saitoella complicata NRRL Y-17804]